MSEETAQLGPSYDGTVMLDIGGEWGALIVTTPPELHLEEIEISPVEDELANVPVSQVVDEHEHTHEHGTDEHGHTHDDHGHSHARVNHPRRTHVAVRERRGPAGVRYAAIYPSLHEGEYHLWNVERDTPKTTVRITGGEVTQIDWA